MRWTILIASVAVLLSSESNTALAFDPPEHITIPYLLCSTSKQIEWGKFDSRPGKRDLTWYGYHHTPPEILRAGMDPRKPSTNEWIARAHYKKLVEQFEEWKLYRQGKPTRQWPNFAEGDRSGNIGGDRPEAIEALFDHKRGTLTVAVFYDDITKRHFVSTVPRSGIPRLQGVGIRTQMRRQGAQDAPHWHAVATGGSEGDNLVFHAEDGAYYFFEKRMRQEGRAYSVGGRYRPGSAVGAWGGGSDYHVYSQSVFDTTADADGSRYGLCSDGFEGRGNRGCRTVASRLGVAFNGDGTNKVDDYGLPSSPCRRDGKPIHIRGREVACPLNLQPTTASRQGVQAASKTLKAASHKTPAATAPSHANLKPTQPGLRKHTSSAKPAKTSLNKHASSGKPTRTSAKKLGSSPPKPTKTGLKKLSPSPKPTAKTAHSTDSTGKKAAATGSIPAKGASTLSKNGKGSKP